jgi:hypothetical protein
MSKTTVTHTAHRISYKDRLSLLLSSLAFVASAISVLIAGANTYIQWFLKQPSIGVELKRRDFNWVSNSDNDLQHPTQKFPNKMSVTVPMSVINNGNETVAVQDMKFQLFGQKTPSMKCVSDGIIINNPFLIRDWQFFTDRDPKVSATSIIAKPGEIIAHNIQFYDVFGNSKDANIWTGCLFFEVIDPEGGRSPERIVAFSIVPSASDANTVINKNVVHGHSHYEAQASEVVDGKNGTLIAQQAIILNLTVEKLTLSRNGR